MKKTVKFTAILASAAILLSLTACGEDSKTSGKTPSTNSGLIQSTLTGSSKPEQNSESQSDVSESKPSVLNLDNEEFKIVDGDLEEYKGSAAEVTVPDGVTAIGRFGKAFNGNESITKVTLPNSVTSIGRGAFGNCKSLKTVNIPDGVTFIGEGAFKYCKSLTDISLPDSVKTFEKEVFNGCESLTSFVVPESVSELPIWTFYGCKNLSEVKATRGVVHRHGRV